MTQNAVQLAKLQPVRDLQSAHRKQFVDLIDYETLDWNDVDVFRELLHHVTHFCGVSQVEIAEQFKISGATMSRWITGKAAPYPAYRAAVVKTLRDYIASRK